MHAGVAQRKRLRSQTPSSAGSNPAPGTLVDPVTGLSRRSLLFLAVAVALGVVASTVATVIAASSKGACPDEAYGCARFEDGEAVQLAMVVARPGPASMDVPSGLGGRPVEVHEFAVGCSVEDAVTAAREIATDPPDGPPFLAAASATCPRASLPIAQILDDSGISLVVTGEEPELPRPAGFALAGPSPSAALASVLQVAEGLVEQDDHALLVPRTQLRDGLVEAGLPWLDPERPVL